MQDEGLPSEGVLARRSLDVRYVGQSYEINVDFPSPRPRGGAGRTREVAEAIASAFHRAHRKRFGYADPSEPVEIVNLRLKMVLPMDKPLPQPEPPAGESPGAALTGEAMVTFADGACDTLLYLREVLHCGNRISGPALVLQMDSTTVIPPGWIAEVDRWKNLVITC